MSTPQNPDHRPASDNAGERLAVYAGSFDPPTLGHIDVIARATRLFDRVLVAVGSHPKKRPMFSQAERVQMIRECTKDIPRVDVTAFSGLTVDLCHEVKAVALVRGLRASSDFDSEFQLGLANRDLSPDVETVFLLPDVHYQFVSSSLVRELAYFGGDHKKYVKASVAEALARRTQELKDGTYRPPTAIDAVQK